MQKPTKKGVHKSVHKIKHYKEYKVRKFRKTICLSGLLWEHLDSYASKNKYSRSRVAEMAIMTFFSDKTNEDWIDHDRLTEQLAVINQRIKNKKERKIILEE